MFCPTCKSEIPNKSKFCIKCGNSIYQTPIEEYRDDDPLNLLNKGDRLLTARNFSVAKQHFGKFLHVNPNSSEAHLGILLAELHFDSKEQLSQAPQLLHNYPHFKEALSLAPPEQIEWYRMSEQRNRSLLEDQQQLRQIAHEDFVRRYRMEESQNEESRKSKDRSSRIIATACLIVIIIIVLFLCSKLF